MDRREPAHFPLAYLITFSCYGTRLHGSEAGSVDREHNVPETPFLPADEHRLRFEQEHMDQPAYSLDAPRRRTVLQVLSDVCSHRGWRLLAAHVRSNHVHTVVQAPVIPEQVMNAFKAYASRRLTEAGFEPAGRKRWTRHGSTRYLWEPEHVDGAVHYVLFRQGEPMEHYPSRDLLGAETEPLPDGRRNETAP